MNGHYKTIKVLGERNSGTNFVNQVLNKNFRVRDIGKLDRFTSKLVRPLSFILRNIHPSLSEWLHDTRHTMFYKWLRGWKHKALSMDDIDPDILYICVIRHPVTWEKSFLRRPYQSLIGRTAKDLEEKEWILTKRDKLEVKSLKSFRDLWNLKYRSYHKCSTLRNVLVLKYEDFLLQPDVMFEELKKYLSPRLDRIYLPNKNAKFRSGGDLVSYIQQVESFEYDPVNMLHYDIELLDYYYPSKS